MRNHMIRAQKVRLIDEAGENVGIVSTSEAIKRAVDAGKDLILITAKVDPPVARIMEYGKYKYEQEKKEKSAKQKQKAAVTIKGVRFSMRTSGNDLTMKAKTVDKFLSKGYKVRVEMLLRGREKALRNMATKKIEEFLSAVETNYIMEQGPEKSPRGLQFTLRK